MENETKDDLYQQEYDKAMAELEGETSTPETTEPENDAEQPIVDQSTTDETADETKGEAPDPLKLIEELNGKLSKTQQALEDTKRWGHENAEQLRKMQREQQVKEHQSKRPEILDHNDGLEEAIDYVTSKPKDESPQPGGQAWEMAIRRVHPDFDQMFSSDADFQSEVRAAAAQSSTFAYDPIEAINVINKAKLNQAERTKQKAVQQALKDFQVKEAQKSAMHVPGSGSSGAPSPTDTEQEKARRFNEMNDDDFEKERRRVRGY